MKLTRYRVTAFRSVEDSGWLDVNEVTALIGVNESGKTNLLLPLWKLNPAREGAIEPTADYPVTMFTDIRKAPEKYCFVSAEFVSDELGQAVQDMTGVAKKRVSKVRVSRFYDGKHTVTFPDFVVPKSLPPSEIAAILQEAASELSNASELKSEVGQKDQLIAAVEAERQNLEEVEDVTAAQIEAITKRAIAPLAPEPPKTSSIAPVIERLRTNLDRARRRMLAKRPELYDGVPAKVLSLLPKFVYYSNYGNLDSEIYLPHVVQNLKRDDLGQREAARARTLRVLFSFVGLQPEEILQLGQELAPNEAQGPKLEAATDKKNQRSLLLQSAQTKLTKAFRQWWKQGDYRFRFVADGNHFQIWVSDERRPEEVKLESRSTGLQWFLSFFLVFLVESGEQHANAILLLDEPGHSLHPLAQRDLSEFFDALSKTNQLIYTTHSPFLIDADRLERARKVYMAKDGTSRVTENLRHDDNDPKNAGAAYAVHSAINLSISEALLLGCAPVIVEGRADQIYLTGIKSVLIGSNKIHPKRELVFPPSGGVKTARSVASILTGRDEALPMMLLDGDEHGVRMATQLATSMYQEAKDLILSTDTYAGFAGSEVEDILPSLMVAECVDKLLRPASADDFSAKHVVGRPIIPQIEAWASTQSIELPEGWKVELAKVVKQKLLDTLVASLPDDRIEAWIELFNAFARSK